MSAEHNAAELEGIYKSMYADTVSALERYATQPVPEDAKLAILRWRQSGSSLPHAAAQAVVYEAKVLEKFYDRNCDALEIPIPPEELRLSTLYPYASDCLSVIEEHLRSGGVVEKGFEEALKRYSEKCFLGRDNPAVIIAEGHINLNSWAQRLAQNPSGFSLIDGIVSGELPSQLVHSIIRPREMPYMRVIELGAQRYKSFYQAASK